MFNIDGKTKYKVVFCICGKGKSGDYSFLTVEDKLQPNMKFPERLKVNIWGVNLSDKVHKDDYITILNAKKVGLTKTETKDGQKSYYNLTIICDEDDIIVNGQEEQPQKADMEQVSLDDLDKDFPF